MRTLQTLVIVLVAVVLVWVPSWHLEATKVMAPSWMVTVYALAAGAVVVAMLLHVWRPGFAGKVWRWLKRFVGLIGIIVALVVLGYFTRHGWAALADDPGRACEDDAAGR